MTSHRRRGVDGFTPEQARIIRQELRRGRPYSEIVEFYRQTGTLVPEEAPAVQTVEVNSSNPRVNIQQVAEVQVSVANQLGQAMRAMGHAAQVAGVSAAALGSSLSSVGRMVGQAQIAAAQAIADETARDAGDHRGIYIIKHPGKSVWAVYHNKGFLCALPTRDAAGQCVNDLRLLPPHQWPTSRIEYLALMQQRLEAMEAAERDKLPKPVWRDGKRALDLGEN